MLQEVNRQAVMRMYMWKAIALLMYNACSTLQLTQAGVCSVCKVGIIWKLQSLPLCICAHIFLCMCGMYVHIEEIFYPLLYLYTERYIMDKKGLSSCLWKI